MSKAKAQTPDAAGEFTLPEDMTEQQARESLSHLVENDTPLADVAEWMLHRL